MLTFFFQTDQGIINLPVDKAHELTASDPDYALRDLYNAIANGKFPSWTLQIQIMTFEQARTFKFNPFDLTKVSVLNLKKCLKWSRKLKSILKS